MIINDSFRRKDFREAADSGVLIWRQNAFAFLPFFVIPFIICAAAARLFPQSGGNSNNWNYFSWLAVWLLKPLFDRIILHIISVRFFESGADFKRLLQGLSKSIFRGLAGDLLWRRFSPMRSAMMPVRVLERNINSEKGIAQRRKLLENGGLGYGFLLTVWGIAAEIALLTGGILFFITTAELISGGAVSFLENFSDREIIFYAAWCMNYILVETIYVCMGFGLYINSRIEVEGWDIEIAFRNLAEKLKEKNITAPALKIPALVVLLSVCLFFPQKNHAADAPQSIAPAPLETLKTILESPDFGGEEDSWGIRLKNPPKPREIPQADSLLSPRLQQIFAYVLLFFLIAAACVLLVFLAGYIKNYRQIRLDAADGANVKTFNSDAGEDPNLLLEKALRYYENGRMRQAWGYCAAAAVNSWRQYRGIVFPPDADENGCADIVSARYSDSSRSQEFSRLINHWVYFAYAGQLPPEGSFEEAAALCKSLRTENE